MIRNFSISFAALVAVSALSALRTSSAFQNPIPSSHAINQHRQSPTELSVANFNIFGGLFGGGGNDSSSNNNSNGPNVVVDLPADEVKVGALKFFLQIYLVGEQNKPLPGSWALNQNDENQSIDMYYKDGTGMFSIKINEVSIQISRYGERPSLEYMLQESVFLHGILDEINELAYGTNEDDIEEDKRLIQFADTSIMEKAREGLPARKAQE